MAAPARRAVFLDRDGVLNAAVVRNGKPYPPARPEEVELISGVIEACKAMRDAGAMLFCVTNQPDVARGKTPRADVEAINRFIGERLSLDEVVACMHDDKDNCACRKPKPGMLTDLAKRHNIDLSQSVMVGDRWRDIEAGDGAGCFTVFIDYGYDEQRPGGADCTAGSLAEAAPWIIGLLKTGMSR